MTSPKKVATATAPPLANSAPVRVVEVRRHFLNRLFLNGPFFPPHEANRMANEGNVEAARDYFLKYRPPNLNHLLQNRFGWMAEYLKGKKEIYELGSGAGLSQLVLNHPHLKLTDVVKRPWTDLVVDALKLPFANASVDVLIASHMLHHVAYPKLFFSEAARVLKPNGVLLIAELNTSLILRLSLWLMRHEGWSYDLDVFNHTSPANHESDPWSANCAIPELLFSQPERFEAEFPALRIRRNTLCESLLLFLSGGVIAKTRTIQLPLFLLKAVDALDKFLVWSFPELFAVGRRIVLQKVG